MNGTSWLLGGGYPWYSGDPAADRPGSPGSSIVANARDGLSLSTLRDGPLGLMSADGSLGRLTLPLGVAVDGDDVLILSADGTLVFRYDGVGATLVPLPQVGADGLGTRPSEGAFAEPRRFRGATNIAATGGALYVADPAERRVQVFDLATLALIRIHAGLGEPVDVAAGSQGIYILDRAGARVYRASPASDGLTLVADVPKMRGRWSRIAVDRDERIYLLDVTRSESPSLDIVVPSATGPATTIGEQFVDSAQVRDRFAPPAIHVDDRRGFKLADRLADPCGLRRPADPHTRRWRVGASIYVIDARTRQMRVHLADGRLRHRFGPYDGGGTSEPFDSREAWSPVDLATVDGCVVILDERYQSVYAHRPGTDGLRRWFTAPAGQDLRWRRVADDGAGCLLLWDGASPRVERFDPSGRRLGEMAAREARPHFDRSASRRQAKEIDPPPWLTRHGAVPRPRPETPEWPEPTHSKGGVWTSRWLDSDLYDCQWHLLEVSIAALPPGSRVVIKTRTSNDKQSDAEVLASLGGLADAGSWREIAPIAGPPQPAEEAWPRTVDFLVPSGPGQHIQLRMELAGNGLATPVIASVRLRFPRESLLQYLPAIYSSPEEQRQFLDRFLAIMQTSWWAIERGVDTFERFLDPDSVPPDAMPYLASWLDVQLEGSWTPEENRRLLQAMPRLRSRWGTPEGMLAWLRVYLAKLGGVDESTLEKAAIPGIVESFVERRRLMLGQAGSATLGAAEGLWSPSVERRFQVGVFDREGEVELVSTGDPELDVFRHYAHSFRVYIPAAWVRTPEDEALIRRAIETQKPAHTTYELVLVEARLSIGDQSTVDLDTVIGAPLAGPLVCATVEDAPSRPPYQRLGFDTTLGCEGGDGDPAGLERSLA